ncbi:MAG: response regulator transcription factor [Flavobacteriaceae bacterium]|nr:response regulator transcription factor [Flavobacteriaceae bacterium]
MAVTNKINTIIIEDNKEAQDYLKGLINRYFGDTIEVLAVAESIEKAVEAIHTYQPELVFMDIELTDGHSFEIFNRIDNYNFEVVFVTAFKNYLQKAIDHFALSYVVKPILPEKLIEIVERYVKLRERIFSINKYTDFNNFIRKKEAKIFLNTGKEHVGVKVENIIKCEADGNYTHVYLNDDNKYMASNSLGYYQELLDEHGFFKPHRSVIINTDYIKSIYKKESIILTSGESVNISVRNRSKLTDLIASLS